MREVARMRQFTSGGAECKGYKVQRISFRLDDGLNSEGSLSGRSIHDVTLEPIAVATMQSRKIQIICGLKS